MADFAQDEEVVERIPVHVSPSLSKYLLLQYPLRAASRGGYDLTGARYKAKHGCLELETAEGATRQQGRRLVSTTVEPATNYAIGVLRGGALYLAPIETMAQIRPSFAHVDDADPAEESETKAGVKKEKVSVSMKRRQSIREAAARLNSFAHKRREQEAEPWQELRVHPPLSQEAQRERASFAPAGGAARRDGPAVKADEDADDDVIMVEDDPAGS